MNNSSAIKRKRVSGCDDVEELLRPKKKQKKIHTKKYLVKPDYRDLCFTFFHRDETSYKRVITPQELIQIPDFLSAVRKVIHPDVVIPVSLQKQLLYILSLFSKRIIDTDRFTSELKDRKEIIMQRKRWEKNVVDLRNEIVGLFGEIQRNNDISKSKKSFKHFPNIGINELKYNLRMCMNRSIKYVNNRAYIRCIVKPIEKNVYAFKQHNIIKKLFDCDSYDDKNFGEIKKVLNMILLYITQCRKNEYDFKIVLCKLFCCIFVSCGSFEDGKKDDAMLYRILNDTKSNFTGSYEFTYQDLFLISENIKSYKHRLVFLDYIIIDIGKVHKVNNQMNSMERIADYLECFVSHESVVNIEKLIACIIDVVVILYNIPGNNLIFTKEYMNSYIGKIDQGINHIKTTMKKRKKKMSKHIHILFRMLRNYFLQNNEIPSDTNYEDLMDVDDEENDDDKMDVDDIDEKDTNFIQSSQESQDSQEYNY